jgi:amidohydrolase
LSACLRGHGLAVALPAYGLATAFVSRTGSTRQPHVVVCCEYDALPSMGHACGHNIIAAAGVGAGLALARLAPRLGGCITVLGTPAEEGGGGKLLLARRGAFEGVDAVMLVHPSSHQVTMPHINAVSSFEVTMLGQASHASMAPEQGVNALDALVLGYTAVAALRQHLRPTEKVHGIITRGGDQPSVVPALARGRFMVRGMSGPEVMALLRRVHACFEGGARATGATVQIRPSPPQYREMWHSRPLAAAFEANALILGRRMLPPHALPVSTAASTDLGDVSHLVAAIHPKLKISPDHVAQHSAAFAGYAASAAADRAVVDGAKALAMTAIDVWCRSDLRRAIRAEHAMRARALSRPRLPNPNRRPVLPV